MLNFMAYNALNYAMTDLEKYKAVAAIFRLEQARAKIDEKNFLLTSSRYKIDHQIKSFYSNKFMKVLSSLSKNYKHLLENEFLKDNDSFWYTDFYSKTTYYKYRKNAVNEFLIYYFEDEE
ncbi:MG284/MPN403 family protein [Mycoplasmopsis primatum]|uniref:MG284/MPN403 family protein n=1 Tax=Mycoplasmopsis primatum TaxID=55604 RepID=UPI0004971C8E|nr:hypothetical protein [Mycoplasmopsis primatum]